jgi:LysR family glycine cleavage system transcriptional activator
MSVAVAVETNIMNRRMPPLNGLKAFEAAARHLSFTKAADELSVTQAAVSHQVRTLEDYFNIAMFNRNPHGLTLTSAGKTYLPILTEAFDMIAEGYKSLPNEEDPLTLNIKAPSSFSVLWLVPRLKEFQKSHPQININLSAQDNDIEFFPEAFDIEIQYEFKENNVKESLLLFKEEIFPVCSPDFLKGENPLKEPADLAQHTLLHINYYPEDWEMWLEQAGVSEMNHSNDHRFDQSLLTLNAAAQGLGIAMGRTPIVNHQLATGTLIEPFGIRLKSQGGYRLFTNTNFETKKHVEQFKEWISNESLT